MNHVNIYRIVFKCWLGEENHFLLYVQNKALSLVEVMFLFYYVCYVFVRNRNPESCGYLLEGCNNLDNQNDFRKKLFLIFSHYKNNKISYNCTVSQ